MCKTTLHIFQQAVESVNGKLASDRIVKGAVQCIIESTQVPNSYQIGERCQISAKENPELRRKGECWAMVPQLDNFSLAD